MAELSKKMINRREMMNRTIAEFIKLNSKKTFLYQEESNLEKHECILAVTREIGKVLNTEISIPNDWDKRLSSLMDNSKIVYREVVLEYNWQRKDCGILIAFLEDDKIPVALFPDRNGYRIFNPQTMSRQKLTSKIAKKILPDAYCFYNLFPDKEITHKDLLQFTLKQFYKRDLVLLIGITFGISIISMFFPVIMGIILDKIIPLSQRNSMFTTGVFLIMFLPTQIIFYIMQMLLQVRIETKSVSALQSAIWHRVLHYNTGFFRRFSVGDLVSRLNNTGKIQKVLQENLIVIVFSFFMMVLNLIIMIFYNAKFSLMLFAIITIWVVLTIPLNKSLLKLQSEITNHTGNLSGFLLQLIKGISKVQAASAEYTLFSRWATFFTPILGTVQKQYFLQAKMRRLFLLIQSSVISLVYFLTAQKLNLFSIGQFAAFTTAVSVFLTAVWDLYDGILKCLMAATDMKRIEPIFKETPQICGTAISPGGLSGAIDVQHVTFRYSQNTPAILKDISLSIKPGEFIAFVGGSGCGKSTLMRLLLGFETPESGSIKVDGQDLTTLDCKLVRKQFGVVLQNGKLFSGDIFSNIAGAGVDLPLEDAWKAAEMAGIADDIKEMPMGMFTQISDSGENFSGGQRQRLLIARAIAHNPKVLLFDEATSALDNKTQALVSQSIEKLNATRIAIAHRISTIKNADKIFVFSKGYIEECGTYEELMNAKGTFYQLAKRQMI